MSQSMFRVAKGLNLDGVAQVMSAAGTPGAAGDASLAPKGSLYLDITNGQLWVKKTAGVGADKWLRTQDSNDMAAAMQGISWREPAKLHVSTSYADLAAATTAMNTGTLDGTAVVANDRILFDNITGSNKNVFIVTGTPGSNATLVEDTNTATKGDTVYVSSGSDAGKTFNYNGTLWVQQGGASSTEIGFIQAFIGKQNAGNEMPAYNTHNVVTDGEHLMNSIGELDAKLGTVDNEVHVLNYTNAGDTHGANIGALDYWLSMAWKWKAFSVPANTLTAIDTLTNYDPTDVYMVTWKLVVNYQGTPGRWYGDVTALIGEGANTCDFSISNVLTVDNPIPGLEVSVVVENQNDIKLKVQAGVNTQQFFMRSIVGEPD
ncbi:MAG: hypothetical protein H7835_17110 [Magnetococcus sp. XQGC-1]